MSRDFRDLVDVEGLSGGERERLERVHGLLVAAGPPPELTAALADPPAHVIPFPAWRRRRTQLALVLAATVAGACFGGGYLLGHNDGMKITHVMSLRGEQNSLASLRVGTPDAVGNSPMVLSVTGLPKLEHGYYELFTMRDGKPGYPCGGFKMVGGTTKVQITVPYELKPDTKLVITLVQRGKAKWPGRVVMRSV